MDKNSTKSETDVTLTILFNKQTQLDVHKVTELCYTPFYQQQWHYKADNKTTKSILYKNRDLKKIQTMQVFGN